MERPWETDEDPPEDNTWRGDMHLDDWPEHMAGPEYWLFKKHEDDEEGGDADGPTRGR